MDVNPYESPKSRQGGADQGSAKPLVNRVGRALAAGCYFTSVFTFVAFGLVTVLLFGWSVPFAGMAIGLGVVVPLLLVWLWFRG